MCMNVFQVDDAICTNNCLNSHQFVAKCVYILLDSGKLAPQTKAIDKNGCSSQLLQYLSQRLLFYGHTILLLGHTELIKKTHHMLYRP